VPSYASTRRNVDGEAIAVASDAAAPGSARA
jgi:hypothetical protein